MLNMYLYRGVSANIPAIGFLKGYGVSYDEVITTTTRGNTTGDLTREDVYRMLSKTENGFEDILAVRSKHHAEFMEECLNGSMSVAEAVDFVVNDPRTLRSPIIEGNDFVVVGFNDDIRRLVPREIRHQNLNVPFALY